MELVWTIVIGFIGAFVGALLLLAIYHMVTKNRTPSA